MFGSDFLCLVLAIGVCFTVRVGKIIRSRHAANKKERENNEWNAKWAVPPSLDDIIGKPKPPTPEETLSKIIFDKIKSGNMGITDNRHMIGEGLRVTYENNTIKIENVYVDVKQKQHFDHLISPMTKIEIKEYVKKQFAIKQRYDKDQLINQLIDDLTKKEEVKPTIVKVLNGVEIPLKPEQPKRTWVFYNPFEWEGKRFWGTVNNGGGQYGTFANSVIYTDKTKEQVEKSLRCTRPVKGIWLIREDTEEKTLKSSRPWVVVDKNTKKYLLSRMDMLDATARWGNLEYAVWYHDDNLGCRDLLGGNVGLCTLKEIKDQEEKQVVVAKNYLVDSLLGK